MVLGQLIDFRDLRIALDVVKEPVGALIAYRRPQHAVVEVRLQHMI